MAFKFPLATVLRVRGIIEEREEGVLQKILFDISQTFDGLERTDDPDYGIGCCASCQYFQTLFRA